MNDRRWVLLTMAILLLANLGDHPTALAEETQPHRTAKLTLRSTEESNELRSAVYLKATGLEMIKDGAYSPDNGRTWSARPASPDFDSELPYGYRRGLYPPFVDPVNGNVVSLVLSLDTPGLDPNVVEPPVGEEAYYLRYRVSVDGGQTYLFDKPLVQVGKTVQNPFEGVYYEQNGYYVGDAGSQVIRTRSGRIIIPAQAGLLDSDGKLRNLSGQPTYTDAMMILGSWQKDNTIQWTAAKYIQGDPARSTRGMIEPTIAQMPDERLLCVMRGSNGGANDPEFNLPGYKWYSVSNDDGDTWTEPQPWAYDNDKPFFSPSAMSQLMPHSSGRYLWIGNISQSNSKGNDPRFPLVIGEVDSQTLKLIESTVLVIDTKRPDEPGVNMSHWWGFEDRETNDIVLAGQRSSQGYLETSPVTYRIGVQ